MRRQCLFTVVGYLVILGALVILEERLIFLSRPREEAWVRSPDCPVEEFDVRLDDGGSIKAWWCPRDGATSTVLFCHGCGGNLGLLNWVVPVLRKAAPVNVLAFGYPGYAGSTGQPSEAGCHDAARAAYDWLIITGRTKSEQLVLMGHSMGCAVACELAQKRPHRALVLLCAFTTMRDCGQELLPIFPVRWLMRSQFNCIETIKTYTRPLLIAHGDADTLVPMHHGEELFAASPSKHKVLHRMPGGTHVTLDSAFFTQFSSLIAGLSEEE